MDDDVMISVDPHKASNTAAVMDPVTKVVVAKQRFANTVDGYRQLREFSSRWERRRWAVEGCHGAGHSLAQRLVGDGELVLDVPAKLAARVRVYSQGHGRKTDVDDAVSIGLAARTRREDEDRPRPDQRAGRHDQQPADPALRCRPDHRRPRTRRGGDHRPIPLQGALRVLQRHRTHRRLLRRPGPAPALPSRQPPTQPRAAHDGRDPDPLPRQHRTHLLRTQAAGRQNPERGDALPQAAAVRRRLPTVGRRPGEHNRIVRITYDRAANAAYIYLTDQSLTSGRDTVIAATPPGTNGTTILDWKDGRLVGIEILDADQTLPADLLDQAENITND